ncbi:MAG: Sir2 family NAD-dependent protein deacetylase [Methanobrevibacter sp.]|uniref:Sir2 family NAD-dependent protein deacetylase n=1 Tax=Methanobrevibacter sp. TaxID=66852 RepID=UPI0026E0962C|nr:Sir2 family NAD-dependent protein deacetylase [Methanobrevibacter sp.]MDO5849450.1 Sir2 family NAD-dependent protein deacetylase [Methanobrevibacter sp.]
MDRIEKARDAIENADYVLIGGGAGLSAAAGIDYGGDRFRKLFSDYIEKYDIKDMYSATFYPFKTPEEKWGYLSRHVYENRYNVGKTEVYQELFDLVRDKDYFVITTNVDKQFHYGGFDSKRIFEVQGDYGKFQCSVGCHDRLYDNEAQIIEMVESCRECRIPSSMVPKCLICGEEMDLNIRKNSYFVEDESWKIQSNNYRDFLNKINNEKTALLELGVGYNTPTIIRFPFEQITYGNENATLIRFNRDYPEAIEENKNKTISFSEDIKKLICKI